MQKLTFGFCCIASVFIAGPVVAAEWSSEASVDTALTYTDNVCLSADNTQDQWIGIVTPAGNVSAEGSRASLDVVGSVAINTLTNSELKNQNCSNGDLGNREQFAPRVRGNANAILVENWFYIDGTLNVSQNQVTPFASGGDDPLDRTGNTNTTYDYRVSPYILRRFKDVAELSLRYTWSDQYNSTDVVRDSSQESATALVSSVPGVSRYSWGVQGDYSKVSYSDSRFSSGSPVNNKDSELKSAQINQGFQFSRKWQVNGFYGRDWNDFVSFRDDIDGTYWDVGLKWTPNARTTVDAGIGDRFFGNNPRFSISHRHKRSIFNANYARTITYDRNIRTLPGSPPGNPDFPPPPDVDSSATTITSSPILDERFTMGYSYQGLRMNFGASAFQSDQKEQGSSSNVRITESTYRGISLLANRSLSDKTSLTARAGWSEQKPKNSQNNGEARLRNSSETWSGSLSLGHKLGQRTNLGLTYGYTDRQSDRNFNSYTENRITLDLKITL